MKKFNKKFGLLGWLLLFSVIAMGSKIGGDITRFGTLTGTDIELQLGEGRIVWDSATSKMQFSNDSGGITKDIGSGGGGGGGQNFFSDKSFDAESGLTGWTNGGGGTFVLNSSTPINGENDFAWNASAQNDFLRTDLIAIPEKFKGQACEANFTYSGLTSDLVRPQVTDSSDIKLPGATFQNQVDGSEFLQTQTGIVQRTIFFICPSAGDIKFQFLQTAVGNPVLMNFDDVHIGELIGLKQSVLPDIVSAKFDADAANDPTVISQTVDWLAASPASRTGVGTYTITFKSGFFSIIPACSCVFANGTGASQTCTIDPTTSTSQIKVITEVTNDSTNFDSLDFDLICHKQGVDAQQTVQVFTSIPKVAENINNFSAKVSSTDVVSDENVDWINGNCTDATAGEATCTFQAGTFSLTPNCECMATDTNLRNCDIVAQSSSSVTFFVSDTAGSGTNGNMNISCQKHSADFKFPTVQPILVNQVETTKDSGIRTESCRINNNGSASTDSGSGLCAGWISGVNRTALSLVDTTIITGIFSVVPNCTMEAIGTGTDNGVNRIDLTSATAITTRTLNSAGGAIDNDFVLKCEGAR